jgi:hypothetical protein
MTSLTIKAGGELTLPPELCKRYGLTPATPIRVIETRTGLLLIPLTAGPMDPELARELAEWQELSATTWDMFPYEEKAP